MWLHFEDETRWLLLKTRLYRSAMADLVRQMKVIATPDQVTAYRRRRPYIHHGPLEAWRAAQNLQGAWTLDSSPVSLYLMPYALLILDGGQLRRVLPLTTLQSVEVMRRLDTPLAAGVVRFKSGDETLAYSLDDYLAFGEALGEAAKRSLEAPPVFYGKKKDEDELEE